ncbi:methyltransferase domain-containing protein [Massilia sp. 2TAF26]|uniref:methyltransferase domain-containing protein n=1 Tax=Massilia sp. 2TAF26 TaxID=3233012 RepID=UPI003F9E1893
MHKLQSLERKVAEAIHWIEDFVFERRYQLNCSGYIENRKLETIHSAALPHSMAYQAVTCAAIRELIDEVEKTGIVFDHFIDLGSGKGKACFYAAMRFPFRKIIGVEFSEPLVEIARDNAARFGAENIFFVNADAASFCLPPGNNLVFLFNPFSESILKKFLESNADRFRQSRSVIAYANDQHRLCLARAGFVTLFRNQDTQGSLHQYITG